MYSVCLVLFENDVLLLNVKIKHWKCKKLLTSKYDEAKYPFTYFSLIKFIGFFFLGLMFFFWNFPKDSRYSNPLFLFKSCIWMRSFFITFFWFSRNVTEEVSQQISYEFFGQLVFHCIRSSLGEGRHSNCSDNHYTPAIYFTTNKLIILILTEWNGTWLVQ